MAKDIKVGDIVEFRENKYEVTSVTPGSTSRYLMGGRESNKSNLLWLEPIDDDTEEIDGWVNEKRVKLLKRKTK